MEFYKIAVAATVLFFSYLIIVFYLKRKWGLEGNPPLAYSKTHKIIRFSITVLAVALILFFGLRSITEERPFPIMFFPIAAFFIIELVNIYMQKKHGENPKWAVISWVTVGFIVLLFIGAIYFWITTLAY